MATNPGPIPYPKPTTQAQRDADHKWMQDEADYLANKGVGGFLPQNPVTTVKDAVSGPIGDVGHFLGKLNDSETWIRVGETVVGISLVIIGILALVKPGSSVKSAAKSFARSATPQGSF